MSWSLEKLGPHIARALQIPVEHLSDCFRPGRPDELPAILALRRDVYPQGIWWDDEAFVRWRYFQPGKPADFWVFEKDGQLLAGLGLEPVELVVDGQVHPAVRSLDIMVHPTYEGAGLGAVINLLLFSRHPVSLVMGSNPRSHTLISRMFTRVLDLQSWKLLIRSQDAIEQRWTLGPLAKPAALAADAGLALQRWRLSRQSSSHVEVREIAVFDDRVTELSRAVEARGGIMVRRSAEYLNWRFLHNPRIEYRALGGFVGDTLAVYCRGALQPAARQPAEDRRGRRLAAGAGAHRRDLERGWTRGAAVVGRDCAPRGRRSADRGRHRDARGSG